MYVFLEGLNGNQRDATRARFDTEPEARSYAVAKLERLRLTESDSLGGAGAWCYVATVSGSRGQPDYAYLFSPYEPVEWGGPNGP